MKKNNVILPNWPAPANIRAFTTLRQGGVSRSPYNEFNLAHHVGDNPDHVRANRNLLKTTLHIPNEPIWLQQTHSTIALPATPHSAGLEADAAYTSDANQVCVVLTADCLPILLCHEQGTHVAAIHAGWRGLAHGVIEETLKKLNVPNQQLLAWLGPAIGPLMFEVGEEVREEFVKQHAEAETMFNAKPNHKWLANIYSLASLRLQKKGISRIFGGNYCTYNDASQFFSYRRDGGKTGRMASLIWIMDSQLINE